MSLNRRQFLTHTMHGFSGVALAAMLAVAARAALAMVSTMKRGPAVARGIGAARA